MTSPAILPTSTTRCLTSISHVTTWLLSGARLTLGNVYFGQVLYALTAAEAVELLAVARTCLCHGGVLISAKMSVDPCENGAASTTVRLLTLGPAPSGATARIPCARALIVGLGARPAWWIEWPYTLAGQDNHIAYRDCTAQPFDPGRCTWNQALADGYFLSTRKSQAYAVADGIIQTAQSLDMSSIVSSRSGCPVSNLHSTGGRPYDCPS